MARKKNLQECKAANTELVLIAAIDSLSMIAVVYSSLTERIDLWNPRMVKGCVTARRRTRRWPRTFTKPRLRMTTSYGLATKYIQIYI